MCLGFQKTIRCLSVCIYLILGTQKSIAQSSKNLEYRKRNLIERNYILINAIKKYSHLRSMLPVTNKPNILDSLKYEVIEVDWLKRGLSELYAKRKKKVDKLLNNDIRPSGAYKLFEDLNNKELWLKCWDQYFRSVNYIISVYGQGKKLRYSSIDSVSYDVRGQEYTIMLSRMLERIKFKFNKANAFYEKSLEVALSLLLLNNRDESIRYEPLDLGENKNARRKIKNTNFSLYKYSALVIPGEGPDQYGVALSLGGIIRCELAAERYKNKIAPFIILSGGYCHPFQTQYCEAVEMKKYLVDKLGVPESSIIIDPHARHTTTNFRNAGRYLIWYGFPLDKAALVVTAKEQADYIANPKFGERNTKELGYLPYRGLKRVSDEELEFYTVKEVLHRDPIDPLDP